MAWWREARFGLFIHWGLYAIPAGQWGDETNHAEWIMTTAEIPVEEYEQFVDRFNPVAFDADAWVRTAKRAGMKYIVITTKHHDGFALFDSAVSDYDVMATPFGRDIMAGLRSIVGGEITDYTKMLAESREQAMMRMVEDAESKGANAIVGARFVTSMVMSGASELLAYGTAVMIE